MLTNLPGMQADLQPISRQLLQAARPAKQEQQPLPAWLGLAHKAWRQVSDLESLQELVLLEFGLGDS